MENSFAFKNFLYANWYCLFSAAFVHNWGTVRYVTVTILPSLVMLVFPEVLWCSQLDFTDRCLRTPDRYSLVLLCWVLTVFVWRNRSLLTLRLFVCFSAARRHAIHEIFLFSCPRLLFVGTPFFVHATRRLLHLHRSLCPMLATTPSVLSCSLSVHVCVGFLCKSSWNTCVGSYA